MQCGKTTTRRERQNEATATPQQRRAARAPIDIPASIDQYAGQQDQGRKQVGWAAKQQISGIREPCTRGSHTVLHHLAIAGNAEGRVCRVIAREREEENDRDARAEPQR